MLPRLAGIFGWREREITTAKILECRMKQNADLGRQVLLPTVLTVTPLIPQALIPHIHILRILPALTVRIPTAHTPLILPAPTRWFLCSAQAVILCITILPTPPFTATAR